MATSCGRPCAAVDWSSTDHFMSPPIVLFRRREHPPDGGPARCSARGRATRKAGQAAGRAQRRPAPAPRPARYRRRRTATRKRARRGRQRMLLCRGIGEPPAMGQHWAASRRPRTRRRASNREPGRRQVRVGPGFVSTPAGITIDGGKVGGRRIGRRAIRWVAASSSPCRAVGRRRVSRARRGQHAALTPSVSLGPDPRACRTHQ